MEIPVRQFVASDVGEEALASLPRVLDAGQIIAGRVALEVLRAGHIAMASSPQSAMS